MCVVFGEVGEVIGGFLFFVVLFLSVLLGVWFGVRVWWGGGVGGVVVDEAGYPVCVGDFRGCTVGWMG